MKIKIIAVSQETKTSSKGTPYQLLSVTFINKTFRDKTETKNLLPFGSQEAAFKVLSQAQAGDFYEIQVTKNDKGYNDWVSCKPITEAEVGSPAPATGGTRSPGGSASGRDYETREERAAKQVYIVRQSSIDYAIKTLTPGAKAALNPEDVLAVAKVFEQFVFSQPDAAEVVETETLSIHDLDDDIPY